jgi:hypothetical protein
MPACAQSKNRTASSINSVIIIIIIIISSSSSSKSGTSEQQTCALGAAPTALNKGDQYNKHTSLAAIDVCNREDCKRK